MRVLALDTCLAACSVAVLDGDRIAASATEAMERGHQERLAPLAREVMEQAGLAFADLDPAAFRPPPDVPCSMLYVFDQQSEHVRGRLRAGPGPLPVEIGVLLVRPGPGGPQVAERVLQRGSAWPR